MTRVRRNLYLLLISFLVLAGGGLLLPYASFQERISVASAWLSLVLMAAALIIAPLQRLQGRQPPLNIYLRRDLGCWSAAHGLLHFVAGNFVAMNSAYVSRFVRAASEPPGAAIREVLFSGSSILGLAVAVVLLLLLAISSDRALRWLGTVRWKKLQWSAHLALWLSVLHALAFQVLEARYVPLLLTVTASAVVIYYRWRAPAR